MDSNELVLKKAAKVALAALGGLFILGALFYKERALFSDAAFRLFYSINNGTPSLPGNRYGAFIIQVLPYLAQQLNFPVKAIIFCYSISYNLFYFSVAALLVFRYKQYGFAILMTLFYFLFVSESFLWVSETFIGVAWMFLFFAVTIHLGRRNVNIFLLLIPFSLLAALTIFSHFVIIIPTFFLLVFLILEKKNWPFSKKNSVLLISALAVIIALKCLDTSSQPYDQNNLYGLTHFSLQDIINTFTSPILVSFFFRCLTNYWVAIIIFILGIVSLVKHKEKKLAAWIIISLIGNFIVLGLTYPKWDWIGHCFHIESEFASVAVIVAAGFAFSFLPRLTPKVASALLAAIFIIRFIYICIAATPFTLRTNFNEQILAQMRKKGIPKLCIINEDRLLSTNMLSWGLPYESLMMSEMDGDKPQLTFFLVNIDDKHTQEMIADTKSFYNSFNIIPASFLNKKYFSIDTIQPYSIMTYNDLFK